MFTLYYVQSLIFFVIKEVEALENIKMFYFEVVNQAMFTEKTFVFIITRFNIPMFQNFCLR